MTALALALAADREETAGGRQVCWKSLGEPTTLQLEAARRYAGAHAEPAGSNATDRCRAPTNGLPTHPVPAPRQDRNVTICDGERSRIVCAMQANRRHARYCVFHHLSLDTSSSTGRSLFTAHCRPTAAWSTMGQVPPLAVPQLGSCASSGRAWRL